MINLPKSPYLFIIDTDSYAGNFERDMCAYCTGHVGQCEVGFEYADFCIDEETEEFKNIREEADEHGCWRPVSVAEGAINSLCIFFESKPTKKQIEILKRRAAKFPEVRLKLYKWSKEPVKILGFRLVENKVERKTKEIKI